MAYKLLKEVEEKVEQSKKKASEEVAKAKVKADKKSSVIPSKAENTLSTKSTKSLNVKSSKLWLKKSTKASAKVSSKTTALEIIPPSKDIGRYSSENGEKFEAADRNIGAGQQSVTAIMLEDESEHQAEPKKDLIREYVDSLKITKSGNLFQVEIVDPPVGIDPATEYGQKTKAADGSMGNLFLKLR